MQKFKGGKLAAQFPPQGCGPAPPPEVGVAVGAAHVDVDDLGGGVEGCCPAHNIIHPQCPRQVRRLLQWMVGDGEGLVVGEGVGCGVGARATSSGEPSGMTQAESARVERLEDKMKTVTADVAELKDQNTRMERRMDHMDHSLTAIQKHRKQDRDILKWIASKRDNNKTFDGDDEQEDESLTPWDDVGETPYG